MNMQEKIAEIVRAICNMPATDCRSLNKAEKARELLDLVHVPETAEIHEIPLDWDDEVAIYFTVPNDRTEYCVTAGIYEGEAFINLCICHVEGCIGHNERIPLDHFCGKLDGGIRLTEEEGGTVYALLEELAKTPYSVLNKHIGSATIMEAIKLYDRIRYADFCRERGINVWDMDDFDREAFATAEE